MFSPLSLCCIISCTQLFRCDKESGCCSSPGHECFPKRQQAVQKYFFVSNTSNNRSFIEMVEFDNHTECECRPIDHHARQIHLPPPAGDRIRLSTALLDLLPESLIQEMMPRVTASFTSFHEMSSSTSSPLSLTTQSSGNESISSESVPNLEPSQEKVLCKHILCPLPFIQKVGSLHPLKCFCECPFGDSICLKIKEGLSTLDRTQNYCVRTGRCLRPRCEYGGDSTFDHSIKRCPKKETHSSLPINHEIAHRERD